MADRFTGFRFTTIFRRRYFKSATGLKYGRRRLRSPYFRFTTESGRHLAWLRAWVWCRGAALELRGQLRAREVYDNDDCHRFLRSKRDENDSCDRRDTNFILRRLRAASPASFITSSIKFTSVIVVIIIIISLSLAPATH